jgi:putative ABC transport system permease protein
MQIWDGVGLSVGAILAQRTRSTLTMLGIAVGIAAVVLLTSLGSGVHHFVVSEFTQFGTNLVAVTPGKTTTMGLSGAIINTVRPLTIDDAEALLRVPRVRAVMPMVMGNAAVKTGRRSRRCAIYGVGADMPRIWRYEVGIGTFLPEGHMQNSPAVVVLGSTLKREVCGARNPWGQVVRIGGSRYRVVGVMRPKGEFLGLDLDDAVYIPASRGLELFDREGLMEVDLMFEEGTQPDEAVAGIRRILLSKHGQEDFTLISQQQMLDVLGSVLGMLTFAVGALGGISLIVGGIGILTVMTIAIRERRGEIGLLRAIGASRFQILFLFLSESAVLGLLGGLLGLAVGLGLAGLLKLVAPAIPVHPELYHCVLAEGVALAIGLAAGVMPAMNAARLDPLNALRAE